MESVRQLLQQESPSLEALISAFDQIANHGNVAVIKFDGERLQNRYTIFISFPNANNRAMIRTDTDDLRKGLTQVLEQYLR